MRKRLNSLALLLAAGFVLIASERAFASDETKKFQIFTHVGMVHGHYSGVFTGSFEVNTAFDIGTEYYVAPSESVLVRFTQAMDSPDSVPFYTYAGTGMRHYFTRGVQSERYDDKIMISMRPKFRTYISGEAGIAQVIVKSFGKVVQSVANMLEVGVNVGAIYQVSENVGLDVQVGGTLGYGISSTSVNGSTARLFFGGTYFF